MCSFIERAVFSWYLWMAASRALCRSRDIANTKEQKRFPSTPAHSSACGGLTCMGDIQPLHGPYREPAVLRDTVGDGMLG